MTVAEALNDAPVTDLDLSRHVIAATDDTVAATIEQMSAAGYTCALVSDSEKLAGIFTQRDVLTRVVGEPGNAERPITALMTEAPTTESAITMRHARRAHPSNTCALSSMPLLKR